MTAVVLSILWLLWPLAAFLGGLTFPILSGLAALLLLPSAARSLRPRIYMAALLAFFVFAGASAFWSPRHLPLVEFDFANMKFAVRSEMIRVGLLIVAIGGLIAATQRLGDRGREWVTRIARVSLLLQVVIVAGLTLFEQQALQYFSFAMPESGEGVQNISRNSLILAAAAPVLAVDLARGRIGRGGITLVVIVLIVTAAACYFRGVNAGIVAIVAAGAGMAIIKLMPKHGFKVIGGVIALFVMSAPWLFGLLSAGAEYAAADDTISYRMAIWQHMTDLIQQEPVIGHGIGALRTMRETIQGGMFNGELQVPNHAHNMLLQLWVEVGAVGAGLLAIAIFLAGWRLPAPWTLGAASFKAVGIAAAMTAVACVSFDLWNEWWWAVGGLLGVLAAATPRRVALREDRMIGITFGAPTQVVGTAAAPIAVEKPVPAGKAAKVRPADGAADTLNNFNLLRLVFALMVAAYHLAYLPVLLEWTTAVAWLAPAAAIGVQGFFVLSGYLVYASLERSQSIGLYAEKRVRRLYPAYATVVIVCALAAFAASPAARAAPLEVARYLGWNLAFLNFGAPALPGVFETNPVHEVNGALWTLKVEVMFYLILPILAWVLRASGRARWVLIALIYVSAEAWRIGLRYMGQSEGGLFEELSTQLPGQMSFFITGIALRIMDRNEMKPTVIGALIGAVLLAASLLRPEAEPLRAAGLGLVSIWIATGIPRLFDAARFGDLSYGIYIVHFPIIQTALALGLFASPFIGAAAAIGATLIASLLLWHLVERPALRRDSAYRSHA